MYLKLNAVYLKALEHNPMLNNKRNLDACKCKKQWAAKDKNGCHFQIVNNKILFYGFESSKDKGINPLKKFFFWDGQSTNYYYLDHLVWIDPRLIRQEKEKSWGLEGELVIETVSR